MDVAIRNEILLIVLFAVAVFLFLCNFGIAGVLGNTISNILFGIFGLTAYVMPLVLFFMIAFGMVNSGSSIAARKLAAGVFLILLAGIIFELFTGVPEKAVSYEIGEIYTRCSQDHKGGGVLAGSLAYWCYHFMGMMGTVLVVLVALIISIVVITEKSFVSGVKSGGAGSTSVPGRMPPTGGNGPGYADRRWKKNANAGKKKNVSGRKNGRMKESCAWTKRSPAL